MDAFDSADVPERPEPKPFRFLDLPREIRFMIYKLLTNRFSHHTLELTDATLETPQSTPSQVTLVSVTAPTSILATCRLIHDEAFTIVHRTASKIFHGLYGAHLRPRILVDSQGLLLIIRKGGILDLACEWRVSLEYNPHRNFTEFIDARKINNLDKPVANFVRKAGWSVHRNGVEIVIALRQPKHDMDWMLDREVKRFHRVSSWLSSYSDVFFRVVCLSDFKESGQSIESLDSWRQIDRPRSPPEALTRIGTRGAKSRWDKFWKEQA